LEAAERLSDAAWNVVVSADLASTVARFEDAAAWLDRGEQLAERSGDPNMVADVMLIRGKVLDDRGSLEEAREHMEEGLALADETGHIFSNLVGNFIITDQKLRQDEPSAAIPHLEKSSELAAYCNAGPFTMLGQAWLASAKACLDDLSMAESLFGDVGADPYRARAIHAKAMLLETMGRNDEERARLMEASQLFDEFGIKPDPVLS